ncbi:MAG: type II toxin-antitoxin system HicB family antitoxin [Geminicoccaceae bacterium]|nr:type II toxin-antitoxin system HicB family antitoxin [Geminicoccaceae bacterium]
MGLRFYPAILEPAEKGGYGVVFPDFPGCVTAGATAEEAIRNALEALLLHIEGMIEEGLELPEPSAPDAPFPDWLAELEPSRCIRVLLPVELAEKPVRVNIMIEEGLLARIDRIAELRGQTRSAFLAEAARRMLTEDREVA